LHPGYAVLATLAVVAAMFTIFQKNQTPVVTGEVAPSTARPNQADATRPAVTTGIARVIDGDTIDIRGTRVRLNGIDAPEAKQVCELNEKKYSCGVQSTEALIKLIGSNSVDCEQTATDRNGRVVARCKVGSTDIGAWMVEHGWAVAYRRYSMIYVDAENRARADKQGMWSGTFTMPEEWRRMKREGGSNEQQ